MELLSGSYYMKKYRPELTNSELTVLKRLSLIDFSDYNESDVREEYIVPLLSLLGYRKGLDFSVSREESFSLNPMFINVGSTRIRLDYLFSVRKKYFWLIDAKSGKNDEIRKEDIDQAYFYSQHSEIDSIYFAVCNGWFFNLYERNQEDSLKPTLSIKSSDIVSDFLKLDSYIGSTQILPTLKINLLKKIEKIMSSEVDIYRLEEFQKEVGYTLNNVRPHVLENFRNNAKKQQSINSEQQEKYLKTLKPHMIVESLFLTSTTMPEIQEASKTLFESRNFKLGHSNHYLLFDRLFLNEIKPVNYWYIVNTVHFLIYLIKNDVLEVDYSIGGSSKSQVADLLNYWLLESYTFFKNKNDIRVIMMLQALLYRVHKRIILLSSSFRKKIKSSVEFERYVLPEETIAWNTPHPASQLIKILDRFVFSQTSDFILKYYDKSKRTFKLNLAQQEFDKLVTEEDRIEKLYGDKYKSLLSELGDEWSELTFNDFSYRPFNPLASAISNILDGNDKILSIISEDVKQAISHTASLEISNFTKNICKYYDLNIVNYSKDKREALISEYYNLNCVEPSS